MTNINLNSAKQAKNDEFYTQMEYIHQEINAYLRYNPDLFRGKSILCPCDNPERSKFTQFFVENFHNLGIRRLVSTSVTPKQVGDPSSPEQQDRGRVLIIDSSSSISPDAVEWEYLQGGGDFRSAEVTQFRDDADIIITNPPFSLFREFITWLEEGGTLYSIIGSMNAITYKEVFPLIHENKIWIGAHGCSGMTFSLPSHAAVKSSQFEVDGVRYQKLGNIAWFTNIDHNSRHLPLELRTMEDNLKHNKRLQKKPECYTTYLNCDAIEVPLVSAIPSDYPGIMGIPISFLDKYCPEQFEIVGFRKGDDGRDLCYMDHTGAVKRPYCRILIRLIPHDKHPDSPPTTLR